MRSDPFIDKVSAEKLLEAGQHHVSIATGPSIPGQVQGENRDSGGTNEKRAPVPSEVDRLNAHTLEELDELVLCTNKDATRLHFHFGEEFTCARPGQPTDPDNVMLHPTRSNKGGRVRNSRAVVSLGTGGCHSLPKCCFTLIWIN